MAYEEEKREIRDTSVFDINLTRYWARFQAWVQRIRHRRALERYRKLLRKRNPKRRLP